jgi:hypothetical protein
MSMTLDLDLQGGRQMQTTGKATAVKAMMVAAAAMGIALAGCSSADTTGSGASSGPSTSAGTSAGSSTSSGNETGAVASCLVGNWRTTGVAGTFNGNGVNGTLSGGAGVTVNIAADGKTAVNFDKMEPVNFNFAVAGGNVKGSATYGGTVNGTVTTPSGTSGTFEPVGKVDFGSVVVTVDLTSPTTARVADKVALAQFVGTNAAETGNAVDSQPILRKGTYDCSGGGLKLGPPAGTTGVGTWTLEKA